MRKFVRSVGLIEDREPRPRKALPGWLQALYAEGRARFAGRCFDGQFGLVVLDTESERQARDPIEQDPSIRSGVQSSETYPFSIYLAHERAP